MVKTGDVQYIGGGSGGNSEAGGGTGCPKVPFNYSSNPSDPPAPGWVWKGNGPPESGKGAWVNPDNPNESAHPDVNHPGPIGPHWDYNAPDGRTYYIWPNGSMTFKR